MKLINWASTFIQLLPFITCLFYKAFNPQLKALYLYFFLSLVTELTSAFPQFFHMKSSNLSVEIFTICETLIILFIYQREFDFKNKYLIPFLQLAFLAFALSRFSFSPTEYNSAESTVEGIMIISLAIAYFFKLSNNITIPKLTSFYFFWLNTAFLFYFSSSFFLFLYSHVPYVSQILWTIHNIFNIVYNVLLTIGIMKTKTSPRNI